MANKAVVVVCLLGRRIPSNVNLALRSNRLQPQAALMSGNLKISEDMSYVLNHPCVIV